MIIFPARWHLLTEYDSWTCYTSMFCIKLTPFPLDCAVSAAVRVKQREGGWDSAAQLELSFSHPSECQDGAEQQERQRVCVWDVTKIPNVLKVSKMKENKENPTTWQHFSCFHLFKASLGRNKKMLLKTGDGIKPCFLESILLLSIYF